MIGKGYSVRAAELELSMVAEGYNASKCIHTMNQTLNLKLPIIEAIYQMSNGEGRVMVLIELLSKPVKVVMAPQSLKKVS
jgi:glycerol-3-phosphate dehydrogenase (NAD(P)+)